MHKFPSNLATQQLGTSSSQHIGSGYYSPFHETHTEYRLSDLLESPGFETTSYLWKNVRGRDPFYAGMKAEEAYFFQSYHLRV